MTVQKALFLGEQDIDRVVVNGVDECCLSLNSTFFTQIYIEIAIYD
ncbi:hypothetical protein SAMN05444377_102210 [Flavobacterium fontis]|uniref:Uncharacterized protein n=1 Tax=Flavobacterium fontis TaxID=1124188 RepID=A0A1M4XWU5_9FLAO|nr:hypothetical protein SAMN05444377_102210 [Flavobacterium fontis]